MSWLQVAWVSRSDTCYDMKFKGRSLWVRYGCVCAVNKVVYEREPSPFTWIYFIDLSMDFGADGLYNWLTAPEPPVESGITNRDSLTVTHTLQQLAKYALFLILNKTTTPQIFSKKHCPKACVPLSLSVQFTVTGLQIPKTLLKRVLVLALCCYLS